MDKNNFVFYTDYFEQLEMLTLEQRGALITALMQYQRGDPVLEMDNVTKMAYMFISADIRRNNEKYQTVIEKRRAAGRKGGKQSQANQANAYFALANQANDSFASSKQANQANARDNVNVNVNVNDNDNDKDNVSVYVNDNDNVAGSPAPEQTDTHTPDSIIPTKEQIKQYVVANNYKMDPDKFFGYYQMRNWQLSGGQPMTDWKAAVDYWESNEKGPPPGANSKNRFDNFEGRKYDYAELERKLLGFG